MREPRGNLLLRRSAHWLLRIMPAGMSIRLQYRRAHGRWPKLAKPVTFTEKMQRRKLHERDPRFAPLTDKIAVKDFVRERLDASWVTPSLWEGAMLPPRADRSWPVPFVIKPAHGCKQAYFVHTLADLDWDRIETLASRWRRGGYARHLREPLYDAIPKRLIVEPIFASTFPPVDYKFYCFAGEPKLIQVDVGRFRDHRRRFYTTEWEPAHVSLSIPTANELFPQPPHLAELLDGVRRLAGDFAFVRVDLYDLETGPRFGEMTFTPDSGLARFRPAEMDAWLGSLWPDPGEKGARA